MEITDNHLDTVPGISSRNEKKLFKDKPRPSRNSNNNNNFKYSIHPAQKYEHFNSFPHHQYPKYSQTTPAPPVYHQERKYQQHPTTTMSSSDVVNNNRQFDKTTTTTTTESFDSSVPVPNSKNNFFVDWGMKVEDDMIRKHGAVDHHQPTVKPKIKIPEKLYHSPQKLQDKQHDYQMKTYRQPIGTYPGMYDRVGAGGGFTTTEFNKYTSYPAPQPVTTPAPAYNQSPKYSAPVTAAPPAYPAVTPAYTPAPVYTPPPAYTPAPQYPVTPPPPPPPPPPYHPQQYQPAPQIHDRKSESQRQTPAPALTSFYSNFGSFGGQHPKPYQPAITFLDGGASAERRSSNVKQQSVPHHHQSSPVFNNFNAPRDHKFPVNVASGSNQQYQDNYDPFSFGQQGNHEAKNYNTEHFAARSKNNLKIQARSIDRDKTLSRPDDTIYTPAADPRKFFDNQFHASDRFFDMKTNFNQFDVSAGDNTRSRINAGETPLNNNRRLDVTQERENVPNKRNLANDKMINLRSKLFDSREPGGYYIKVFNNDGNNYAIKDGDFHPADQARGRVGSSERDERESQSGVPEQFPVQTKRNIGNIPSHISGEKRPGTGQQHHQQQQHHQHQQHHHQQHHQQQHQLQHHQHQQRSSSWSSDNWNNFSFPF